MDKLANLHEESTVMIPDFEDFAYVEQRMGAFLLFYDKLEIVSFNLKNEPIPLWSGMTRLTRNKRRFNQVGDAYVRNLEILDKAGLLKKQGFIIEHDEGKTPDFLINREITNDKSYDPQELEDPGDFIYRVYLPPAKATQSALDESFLRVMVGIHAHSYNIPIATTANALYPQVRSFRNEGKAKFIEKRLQEGLSLYLPSFKGLHIEQLLEARNKYIELLVPARESLKSVAYTLSESHGKEDPTDLEGFVKDKVLYDISPKVETFCRSLQLDKSKLSRKMLECIMPAMMVYLSTHDWKPTLVTLGIMALKSEDSSIKIRDDSDPLYDLLSSMKRMKRLK